MRARAAAAILAITLVPAILGAEEAKPEGSVDVEARFEEVRADFEANRERLQETQLVAFKAPEVQKELGKLREVTEREMIRLAPEKKEATLRRFEVYDELVAMRETKTPTAEEKAAFEARAKEFEDLTTELEGVTRLAESTASVQSQRDAFQKALRAAMTKADPGAADLMAEQEKLAGEMQQLEFQMMMKSRRDLEPENPRGD